MSKKKKAKTPEGKRAIDRLRESAASTTVKTPDDDSEITDMVVINDTMHIIKELGIYEFRFADEIDPERTNPEIPNTIQRVLKFGSSSEWVGKTLLTGKVLFNKSYFPKNINCDEAMSLMFKIVKNIGAMQELVNRFEKHESSALKTLDNKVKEDRSFHMPAVGEVDTHCKTFSQKADHAARELLDLVKLYYGKDAGKKWFEGFTEKIEKSELNSDNFAEFLRDILPLLQLIRNARNCAEHHKSDECIITTDFSINTSRELVLPTIQIVHPRTPQEAIPVAQYMRSITDHFVDIVELMTVFLCARHVQPPSGFPIQVCLIPEEKRSNKHVRYGFGMFDGTNVIPVS